MSNVHYLPFFFSCLLDDLVLIFLSSFCVKHFFFHLSNLLLVFNIWHSSFLRSSWLACRIFFLVFGVGFFSFRCFLLQPGCTVVFFLFFFLTHTHTNVSSCVWNFFACLTCLSIHIFIFFFHYVFPFFFFLLFVLGQLHRCMPGLFLRARRPILFLFFSFFTFVDVVL